MKALFTNKKVIWLITVHNSFTRAMNQRFHKRLFHRILATTALCLAAVGLSSCNACWWLTVQCQQQASYVCYSFTVPEVAAVRFVDKQGKVILEPSMNRPEVQEFADDLRNLVKIASSVEYAGGELMPREEENVALYVDLVDTEGAAFWRFPL